MITSEVVAKVGGMMVRGKMSPVPLVALEDTVSLRVGGHSSRRALGVGVGDNIPCSSVCGVKWRISEVVAKVGVRVRDNMPCFLQFVVLEENFRGCGQSWCGSQGQDVASAPCCL
jgi:hypothetical protein